MLNENIKAARISKGLSQEALAGRLHVVRQTISKWEKGLSVPDSDMLLSLSEALQTPVSTLLGQPIAQEEAGTADPVTVLAEKLERINLQLAQRKILRRKLLHWFFLAVCGILAAVYAGLLAWGSPYLGWDYSDPETAVAVAALHGFEWLFIRYAPVLLAGAMAGAFLTRKKI